MRTHRLNSPIRDPSLVLEALLWKRDAGNAQKFMSDDMYGHLATVTGATWEIQGRTFDGIDDGILLDANVTKGLAAISLFAWIKPEPQATSHQTIWGDYTGAADFSAFFNIMNESATLWSPMAGLLPEGGARTDTGTLGLTPTFNYGVWTYIGFTWSPNTCTLYGNGVSIDSGTVTGATLENTVTLNNNIGAYAPGALHQNCKMIAGEFHVFSRALNPLEVQRNYLATKWRYIP